MPNFSYRFPIAKLKLIEKGEKTIPTGWEFDENLTDRFNKLKAYQF